MTSRGLLTALDARASRRGRCGSRCTVPPPTRGADSVDCTTADHLNQNALSLPCSVGLDPDAQQSVIGSILDAHLAHAS